MQKKMFKCYKCKKETRYKQFRIIFTNNDGNKKYSVYRPLIKFDLCKDCAKKILDILKGSDKK